MSERGFPPSEFEGRLARAQTLMRDADLSAMLLTTEPEIRYYTGFLTRFWESPTRPWFVIVPASGKPVAVIPSIGAHLMRQTWVDDIRCWSAPDYADDGVSLLAAALCDLVPAKGTIGIAHQMESHLRMPLADFARVKTLIGAREISGDAAITRQVRLVKSDAETAKIQKACQIADRAFDRVQEIAVPGTPLSDVFRAFQRLALEEGADAVPYLAGAAAKSGYKDVISPATEAPLAMGDVLMLDTGLTWDGYFCDFDRNYSVGPPSQEVQDAHARLITATEAGFAAARPGAKIADLFHAMAQEVATGPMETDPGRFGHGLGMQLTEWPSIIPQDETELVLGMVLTLEPSVPLGGGKMMVHEEDILITTDGARYLSSPQAREIRAL